MPIVPLGFGWTSGAAVAGGLAVVRGKARHRWSMSPSIPHVFLLDVGDGSTTWEQWSDRPSPAMVPTTFAHGDFLYVVFGTDWQLHEHANEGAKAYRMDVRKRSVWEIVARFSKQAKMDGGNGCLQRKIVRHRRT